MSGENNHNFGKTCSEETKKKLSISKKGQIPWNKGLKNPYSEERTIKMREKRNNKK